ncbi:MULTISPECIES: TonB-dependent receptor [unclassified Wenzhouxiangella]|uniref:TonB-dependent receptor n=1 Tax=unclassified Wenzhouxiangella TaxID=2613841 RepID=UPI000E327312|nr:MULTISPECIES: TonB-dependent receptor [unclassified Wenzhouxiangella]RFF26295.1 TonB-dependent receptor [Wenzhouxiangella sp. 15181]RFP67434.1 TonB-dependent receptor [Wenzhouxiangella sp. 15190]
MHRTNFILITLLFTSPVIAQTQADSETDKSEETRELDPITVVAHRQPRQLSEVAGTVTVIGEERLSRDMVFDAADLVRYEPGVDLDGGGTRFGFNGFRIRGIGGNRTAVVIDNVPVADQFDVGNFANTGRGLLELGLARRVEILRGPASTIYGSKALGGVVAITTIDVDDIITDDRSGSRIGLRGASDSDRARLTAATAFRNGDFDMLIAGAAQRSAETDIADRPNDIPLDLLDRDHHAVLVRSGLDTDHGRIRLTLDGMRETRDADLRAMIGLGRFAATEALLGDDRRHQWRILLDQELAPIGPVSRGHWRLWRQEADVLQQTDDERPAAEPPVDVFRRFEFRQETTGLGTDLESDLDALGLSQRLGYGFELSRSEVVSKRDSLQTNRNTGKSTRAVLGENFPLRDFPRSEITELGVYLHDEIRLWAGGPTLSPGIRYEYYDLSVLDDPLFESSFPAAETTELSSSSWLPRLGLVWPLDDNMEFFAQYARGLRAPPFEDVNIGLELPQFRVRAIANPDLDPEKGRTLETGLRWRGAETLAELALYRNDYKNFIQTRAPLGFDPATGFLLFQSINRDRVRIEGGELRLRRDLGAGFSTELAGEWSHGEDRDSGRNLPGVSPPSVIAELAWQSPDASLETRLIATATRGQRELVDEEDEPLFSPPGYTTVDWLTRWFPRRDLEIGLGLFNLTDRQYWRTGQVLGRTPGDPIVPLLAEPGRWGMLSLTWHH